MATLAELFSDEDDAPSLKEQMSRYLEFRKRGREEHVCDKCLQRVRKLNPHRMDASKVDILAEIAMRNRSGIPWIKLQRDGNLIKADEMTSTIQCDDVHGLRLTWFRLLQSRGFRTGEYRVTLFGLQFLKGAATVPREILCRDGEVVRESPDRVYIHQVRNVVLNKEYWDNYGSL